MKISPSMLACDFTNMEKEIKKISHSGADLIHLDIMDGNFVPNISFGPAVVKSLRPLSEIPFDVHLMLLRPYEYISAFTDAGADIITFHLESQSKVEETIFKIKQCGKKAGISIKPKTPIDLIFPYLNLVDLVLIMTVEPGFGGQDFMHSQMEKVLALKKEILKRDLNVLIELDGGINLETIKLVKNYPVDICVSGTCIFKSFNARETIKKLKSI